MSPATISPAAVPTSPVADQLLQPFLSPSFDPIDYLNSTLPPLSVSSTAGSTQLSKRAAPADAASLADLSAQAQTLLSQLNARVTRLSGSLTQLTDDILRSGGRLAYQVEVLRGETVGLAEALTDGLRHDVVKFVPKALAVAGGETSDEVAAGSAPPRRRSSAAASRREENAEGKSSDSEVLPPYIAQLRMLTQVRTRLETVIKIFGEAMQWAIPPSEVSLTSSLISVSAPEPGSEHHSREEKGREFAERLRTEIADTVVGTTSSQRRDADDVRPGYEAAMARIQALRDLSIVWKGTAEEKARTKFVDGLVKLAEERAKVLQRDPGVAQRHRPGPPVSLAPKSDAARAKSSERGGGFLENLQRIRDNIYLD